MRVFFLLLVLILIIACFLLCCEHGKKVGKFITQLLKYFTKGEIKQCKKNHSRRELSKYQLGDKAGALINIQ